MTTSKTLIARGLAIAMALGPSLNLLPIASSPWNQALAQTPDPATAQDQAVAKPEGSAPQPKPFKQEELDALLAPIALYPDDLLSQIFIASTYPLEAVEASRWVAKNKDLKGDKLDKALAQQTWDDSVKSLVAFPDVLKKMDENLDWTQKLGDAVLAQQTDVMASVQTLRNKAYAQGNLKSNDQQTVKVDSTPPAAASTTTTVVAPPTQTIVIQQANPQVIYVPTYNPTVVYGTWWYPAYPPYPYYPPGYTFSAGLAWGIGVGIAVGVWNNNYHGGSCDWHGGDININNSTTINRGGNTVNTGGNTVNNRPGSGGGQGQGGKWQHNPEHRKGVSYRDQGTQQKFNKGGTAGASSRDAYRGRSSQAGSSGGPSNTGRGQAGAGSKAGTMDSGRGGGAAPSAGTRDAGRGGGAGPSAGTTDSGRGGGGGSGSGASAGASSRGGSSGGAFSGMGNSGGSARASSARGSSSRGGGGGGGGRRR